MCAKRTKNDRDARDNRDDNELWAEVTKTVTPAKREDVLFRPATSPRVTAAKAHKKKATAAISPPLAKPQISAESKPADLRSFVPAMRAGIDNASAKRMTKGTFEIDERLDLHGKTEAIAHKALLQFVQTASMRGARTLLIITGKGAGGQGVLRRKVPEWLKDYPLKPHILAISQASPKDGGGGALYVRLRRLRDKS